LQELDTSKIYCVVGTPGELGAGASSVVRLALEDVHGWVAVKCFNVYGADQLKRKVVKK